MQIDQIEKKGMFRQAQVSGGQGNDLPVRETQQKQEKRADVVTGSVPVTQTVTYAKPEQEQNTSFSEIKNCAAAKDAVQMKNEMIVGANTSTPESGRALERICSAL